VGDVAFFTTWWFFKAHLDYGYYFVSDILNIWATSDDSKHELQDFFWLQQKAIW